MSEPNFTSPEPFTFSPRRVALGAGLIVVGVLGSFLAFGAVRQAEETRMRAEFEQRALSLAHQTIDGLKRHQDTLYALRNLFHFSEGVARHEFAGAARDLMQRQIGVRALEWVQRV